MATVPIDDGSPAPKPAGPIVKTAKDLSPSPLGMIRQVISPNSTAGMLQGRKNKIDQAIEDAGG